MMRNIIFLLCEACKKDNMGHLECQGEKWAMLPDFWAMQASSVRMPMTQKAGHIVKPLYALYNYSYTRGSNISIRGH